MHEISNKNYWFASLLLHSVILLIASVFFKPFVPILIGEKHINSINSYVFQEALEQPQAKTQTNQEKKVEQKTISKPVTKQIVYQNKPHAEKKSVNSARLEKSNSNGQATERLLTLLHTAIQNHQRYPMSAQELRRQGRVTVKFVLEVNGSVKGVTIVKSSGTNSLDEAALAAVRDAAPFMGVSKYLYHAKEFNIDVVFELS